MRASIKLTRPDGMSDERWANCVDEGAQVVAFHATVVSESGSVTGPDKHEWTVEIEPGNGYHARSDFNLLARHYGTAVGWLSLTEAAEVKS